MDSAVYYLMFLGIIILAVFVYYLEQWIKERRSVYINEPERKYEENRKSVSDRIPAEFVNNGLIEINAVSNVKGRSFILIVDGKEAGKINDQLSFIEMNPGMRDITVLTDDPRRRKVCHKICSVQQFTNLTLHRIIVFYYVSVRQP